MTATNDHSKLSAKNVGEHNLVPQSTVSSAAQVMAADMDFLNAPRMSARTLALHLLQLTECPSCHQPVREPVTLPCGHSSCLACIMQKARTPYEMTESPVLMPSTSHLPPRLPLATTVVACPLSGCSRSAIGRGIGMWKGHSATYGADSTQQSQSSSSISDDAIDGPGELPLDGFVVPTNIDSSSLSVIRPQRRESFSTKYAISKYGAEGQHITKESTLLRTDVTLSKAIDTLRRFANIPDMPTYSLNRQSQSNLHRGAGSSRGRRRIRGNRQKINTRSTQDDTRTQIDERFLAVMGASEEGVDSGTIGGVSAVIESSTDEEEERSDHSQDDFESDYDEHAYDASVQTTLTGDEGFFDDDDDEIGGAYARQDENRKSEKRVRRHTLQRQSISYTQFSHGSLAETIKEAELDDDEALEQPFSSRQHVLDSLHTDMMDIMECQLCYMLLYQPLTTPCGHTFCRRCFSRSLDHSTSCPLCRADMPPFSFFQEHPCSSTLVKLMTANVTRKDKEDGVAEVAEGADANIWGMANMYQERKLAIENEERESLLSTPIFVCTLGFPFMPTILHIFEPRYRLMIRRCLESGHPRFGMVMHSQDMSTSTPGMSAYGTMLEIKTVKMLPDGRSMIETVGSHRFRVMEKGSLDGYTVGRIERVDDVPAEAEHDLEQASMGNFSLWNESSPRSSDRGNRSSDSGNISGSSDSPSSSPSLANSSTMMTMAEAREANAAFQAAIGLDSLNRHAAADERRRPTTVNAASTFVQRPTSELIDVCSSFIETLRSGSAPWLMTRLNDTYGPMPDPSNVAAFGYWMALVMPIDEHEKAKLLPIRSSRLRLCIVVYWIEQLRQTWWFNHGCSIQ